MRWASSAIFKAKTEIPLNYPNVSEDFGFLLTDFFFPHHSYIWVIQSYYLLVSQNVPHGANPRLGLMAKHQISDKERPT